MLFLWWPGRPHLEAAFAAIVFAERIVFFLQLFDPGSSSYTYLVADDLTHEAVLIDPVLEQVKRDLKLLREHGLRLKFTLDTHVHADHVTAALTLKRATGALKTVRTK